MGDAVTTTSIPSPFTMRSPVIAAELIHEHLGKRWPHLYGMRPLHDLNLVGNNAWVVGSTVWKCAVFSAPSFPESDLDLVFEHEADRNAVLELARGFAKTLVDPMAWLVSASPYYARDAARVIGRDAQGGYTKSLIDMWCPPTGITVEENVLSFTEPHRRVAYHVATGRLFRGVHRCEPPGGDS